MSGYVALSAGQAVEFDYRTPGQGGCDASVSPYARPATSGSDDHTGLARVPTML